MSIKKLVTDEELQKLLDDCPLGGNLDLALTELKQRRDSAVRVGGRPKLGRKCSVIGCSRAHHAHGYCESHGRKVRLYGSPYYDKRMHG